MREWLCKYFGHWWHVDYSIGKIACRRCGVVDA